MSETYECASCHRILEKGWSDDEALSEAIGSGFDPDTCAIVCNDCYEKMMKRVDLLFDEEGTEQ